VNCRKRQAGSRKQEAGGRKPGIFKSSNLQIFSSRLLKEILEFTFFSISNSFGTVFCCIIEMTQTMNTVREQARININSSGFIPHYSPSSATENQSTRIKIRESVSWLVSFAVISFLTGLLKFLKIGVTVESITSALFYISLFSVSYFIYRIVALSRNTAQLRKGNLHELN
jgi:hypothetical protein